MRRALLALLLLFPGLFAACSKPSFEPAVLNQTRELDAEVLALVESKVAAVRAAPGDAQAHADLGLVYEANGLWDAAEQSFAHALSIESSKPIWIFHRALALREGGQSEQALAAMREAAAKLPNSPAVQQRLGQWLLDRGEFDAAQAAFTRALAALPDQPEFLTGLANVEIAHERWDSAYALARRALRGNPAYGPAHYAAGQALQALGRTEEAKQNLAAGLNARPAWCPDELSNTYQRYRLTSSALSDDANSAIASGDRARAVTLFEKLLERRPKDADLLSNLGANLVELQRFERAEAVLQQALELAPDSFAVLLNLSVMHMYQKKFEVARDEAARAVELGGTVGRTHFQLGRMLVVLGDLQGGYRELKAAVDLDARDPNMFLALANVCSRLGRVPEARGNCRKAIELDGNSVSGRGMLGLLALGAGDVEEARAALDALEKIAPQDERTATLRAQLQKAGH
ncbi:MAG: tetratricopeptide repeat protein [Planctomycetes bacterium]|nr:tetratricopeptide repeat protein [Planctomycetota bacterium]